MSFTYIFTEEYGPVCALHRGTLPKVEGNVFARITYQVNLWQAIRVFVKYIIK